MKLSIAITSFNEEENIGRCLASVKGIASEIIVVDEGSTDKTVKIAQKYTDKIFLVDRDPMFHRHKQLALDKCTNNHILQIDCDEELSPQLQKEIKKIDWRQAAYRVPRKSRIFGKWLGHTGWYPDYQIKLVKKGKAHYPCKSLHEDMVIDGPVGTLTGDLFHYHYTSIAQFIDRMNRYTTNDAEFLKTTVFWIDVIKFPLDEFMKRFFYWEGYKDGLHGLVLSLLMAFNRLVVFAKLWEQQKFFENDAPNFLAEVASQSKQVSFAWHYWLGQKSAGLLDKLKYKIRNKL